VSNIQAPGNLLGLAVAVNAQEAANVGVWLPAEVLLLLLLSCAMLCVLTLCAQERARLINHIATQPERQWTSSCWSFKNEGKVYGSPMFDALWFEVLQVCREITFRECVERDNTKVKPVGHSHADRQGVEGMQAK
jgi:hypothetical protein